MRRRAGLFVNGSPAYRRLHRACASGLANRRTTRPTFRHANAGHVPQRQDLERRIRPPWLRALRSGAGRFSWAHVEAALRMVGRTSELWLWRWGLAGGWGRVGEHRGREAYRSRGFPAAPGGPPAPGVPVSEGPRGGAASGAGPEGEGAAGARRYVCPASAPRSCHCKDHTV